MVRPGSAVAEVRVRHTAVDLCDDDGAAGHSDRIDPILRRASGASGSARAHRDRRASWLLGPLFLFNNLHSLHTRLGVPWYRYNARYRRIRERLLAENGGLVYVTYFDVARRFLFVPHDVLQHPTPRIRVPQAG